MTPYIPLPIPRIHLLEIDDQYWFPPRLRACVQASLTRFWTQCLPFHPNSPAELAAHVLEEELGDRLGQYTYVDFCAGAGGPTPTIERRVNEILQQRALNERSLLVGDGLVNQKPSNNATTSPGIAISRKRKPKSQMIAPTDGRSHTAPSSSDNGDISCRGSDGDTKGCHFILTDIRPPLDHWSRLPRASQTGHLHYIPHPIDASAAPTPRSLFSLAKPSIPLHNSTDANTTTLVPPPKIFRLYSLAFHHFTDPLACAILTDTLQHSSGFAIYELQTRSLDSLILCFGLFPLLWLGSWYWFWPHWTHLFCTYMVPVVPFVIVADGWVSCLRTRTSAEVRALIRQAAAATAATHGDRQGVGKAEGDEGWTGWRFVSGSAPYAWPLGQLEWFVGVRDDADDSRGRQTG